MRCKAVGTHLREKLLLTGNYAYSLQDVSKGLEDVMVKASRVLRSICDILKFISYNIHKYR